ncbi:TolC family protein [Candidimonas humi]|uniref:Protein CyaE n=1 Tax=Candidimonas humi TaxID=683355 RepID=A0ABV8NT09_9BURK|nr:TolC family protein [Candidimonas humi]MBV6305933.1 TolC family protein [Candidimonas humi]
MTRAALLGLGLAVATALAAGGPARATPFELAAPPDTRAASALRGANDGPQGAATCAFAAPGAAPLSLLDAVQRALCHDPRTRKAWAYIETQRGEVGVSRAAYLPTVTASGSIARVHQHVTYTDLPGLESTLDTRSTQMGLTLDWVLYDFGLRAAQLEHARQLLNAAIASRDDTLQTVFLDTVHAYYDAQTDLTLRNAARETERVARESFDIARAKFAAGAATLADKLQAQTAYSQATLKRIQADSQLRSAIGTLALALGLDPATPLRLPAAEDRGKHRGDYRAAVDTLVRQALARNPRIAEAEAQLKAAQAQADSARSQDRPRISLSATLDRSDTPIEEVTSRQVINNRSIGLQVTIPIFDGFSRRHQVYEADAQVRVKQAELDDARKSVAQQVWKSDEAFTSGLQAVATAESLLDSARQSVRVALGRYKAGVGSLLELLRAQSDLADAQQQRILALSSWKTARFELAASLGRLGLQDAR